MKLKSYELFTQIKAGQISIDPDTTYRLYCFDRLGRYEIGTISGCDICDTLREIIAVDRNDNTHNRYSLEPMKSYRGL